MLRRLVLLSVCFGLRCCAVCPPELTDPLHDAVQLIGPDSAELSRVDVTSNASGLTPCSEGAAEERLAPSREMFQSWSSGAVRDASIKPAFSGDDADDKEPLEVKSGQYKGAYEYASC